MDFSPPLPGYFESHSMGSPYGYGQGIGMGMGVGAGMYNTWTPGMGMVYPGQTWYDGNNGNNGSRPGGNGY